MAFFPTAWYNKSEGSNNFVLYRGVLLLQGLFIIELTTKGLRTNSLLQEFRYWRDRYCEVSI
jgi:hypothetical protein